MKINVFENDGLKTVWCRKGEDYTEKCKVPTLKHGGGCFFLLGCMSSVDVRKLNFTNGIMNSQMHCSILKG